MLSKKEKSSMSYIKQLIITMAFFSLVFALTGCGEQQVKKIESEIKEKASEFKQEVLQQFAASKKLPIDLSEELVEKIAGFRFTHVALIDSLNGTENFMIHSDAEFVLNDPTISEIRNITSISVIGVSDVTVEGRTYQSCNYVNFEGKTILICNRGDNPSIPDKVDSFSVIYAEKIEKASGISNIGFLLFTNVQSGETKLVKNENYVSFHNLLPQSISKIKNGTSWSVVTYKMNPCCTHTYTGGTWHHVCDRTVPACP